MRYDCLIAGAGLSGLVCGIRCAEMGLRTVIISGGMNALHFSSGSIDLMGYEPSGKAIASPYQYLKKFTPKKPGHPYAKVGLKTIRESLAFFKEQCSAGGLNLYDNGEENHFHITGLGTMKISYFSQESVFNSRLKEAFEKKAPVAVLNFDGFRDYFTDLTLEQLRRLPLLKDVTITTGKIRLPYYFRTERNLHEFRSIDLARVFDSEKFLPRIADEIKKAAGNARIVSLPAFIGIENFSKIHRKLEQMTGLLIYEVPSLPPSILGMRIDQALKNRFADLGGELSAGDKVFGGEIIKGTLDHVHTENYGNTRHSARFYVLATGSFFSGGLKSEFNRIEEPLLKLKISDSPSRNKWYSDSFFDKKGQPFISYGVKTGKTLNPFSADGKEVKNLFCTGSILSGYDPVREGSGGGVAISTGYFAANKIISAVAKGDRG